MSNVKQHLEEVVRANGKLKTPIAQCSDKVMYCKIKDINQFIAVPALRQCDGVHLHVVERKSLYLKQTVFV